MAKDKISITVDRELLERVEAICNATGESRSAALERLLTRGLDVEGSLLGPDRFVEFFRLHAPMHVVKDVVVQLAERADNGLVEMVLRMNAAEQKTLFAQRAAEREKKGAKQ